MTLDKHQYRLENNLLTLKVKKSLLFIRSFMFFFAFLFFLLPLAGMMFGLVMGLGLSIGNFISLFIFGVLGFYMLRVALWNTYGKEVINFDDNRIQYIADYGWFKDSKKEHKFNSAIEFGVRSVGYEEEKKGALEINAQGVKINCVTKMPLDELEKLINQLNEL